jgi:prepilin-type N-terminal cleavage/methylation domain-containing protein
MTIRRFTPVCRRRRGFTLIELIATMAVLSAVATVVGLILLNAVDGFLRASARAQLHADVSTALERITRELRSISIDAGSIEPAADMDSITSSSIAWEGDNSIALNGDRLTLSIDGAPARPLLEGVTSFEFDALDEDADPLALPLTDDECEPVKQVVVTIAASRQGEVVTLRTRVFLRATLFASGGGS